MTPDKAALLNFIGGVYGQMKEIDNHIAATGSGAKFAGRSAELKNVFEQVAASTVVQQPAPEPMLPAISTQTIPLQRVETIPLQRVETIVDPSQDLQRREDQLEFSFKEDSNSLLKDIYNVLFDIKKLISSFQSNQNEKSTKKNKKYADCCLCGSKPVYIKDRETHIMRCTSCGAEEIAQTEQTVKSSWNNNNKRL